MEIIRHKINHNLSLNNYISSPACFMDIETTGLNREKDLVYLVGILYYEKDSWLLTQYFLEDISSEKKLLKESIDFMNTFNKIITYNGQSFDIPFLNKRAKKYDLPNSIDLDKSFDLYREVKKNKNVLNLKNLKLKTIEEFLGFYREDLYSGYECINFYKDYIVNKNIENKDKVLKHNFDDLFYMLDTIKIIDKINSLKSFNISEDKLVRNFTIDNFKLEGDRLIIIGSINPRLKLNIVDYNNYYTFKTKSNSEFYLSMEVNKAYTNNKLLCSFINLKNYKLNIVKSQINLEIPSYLYPIKLGQDFLFQNIKSLTYEFIKHKIL